MLEPNKNNTKTVPISSKPVEIDSSEYNKNQVYLRKEELSIPLSSNNINEISSYSAYASAESSPNQNSLLANSESAAQFRSKQKTQQSSSSSKSSSSSLDSFLTIDNSRVMEENIKETPTNQSVQKQDITPTDSYFEIVSDQVNKNFLEDEFQSLPCNFPDEVLKRQQTQSVDSEVKLQAKETISSVINKEIESQLASFSSEKSSLPATTSPSQTKSLKTAIGSFFEKVLFGTGEKESQKISAQLTEQASPKSNEINKSKSTHFTGTIISSNESNPTAKLSTVNSIASASSPNPDCSPYKLLINEMPSSLSKTVVVNDLNSRINKPLDSEKQAELSSADKPINNLIESLASLNHKESDKIDPILSSASKKVAAPTVSSSSEKKPDSENKPLNVVSSVSSNEVKSSSQNSHVDHVPASSREFCMDLNFNLAAAAAATAAGPVVVVSAPDNRFTSNASTSSIHNDLKMILEECNDKTHRGIVDSSPPKKSHPNKSHLFQQNSQPQQQPPKPQRTQTNRTKSASDKKTIFEPSDNDNFDLIKTMMSMENRNKISENKHNLEQPTISWPLKENGRYRYSKEFLNQINEQRSEFISQIYPDIFKAYCYCMNGKYWDPEKYFDISEFDKIPSRNNINNSRNYNYNNNSYNNINSNSYNNNQQSYQNRKRNNSTSNNKYDSYQKPKYQPDLMTTPSTSLLSSTNNTESPQALQVPKNSPKIHHEHSQHLKNSLNLSTSNNNSQKSNKDKKKFNNLLSSLGIEKTPNTNEADKILLNLIKNKEPNSAPNLLGMLNNPNEYHKSSENNSNNILDNLFSVKTGSQSQQPKPPKHFPLVLTAQELEMSQMLTQQKQAKHKLPINQDELYRYTDTSVESSGNTSDAYKQLVKNLSNHPLNSPSAVVAQGNQQKQSNNKQPQWSVPDNGTNALKQLLNLNIEKLNTSSQKHERKPKKKSKGAKSPSTSMLNSQPPKFPAVNPHEKPFESYFNDKDENNENKDKHVETVVASTLNHVLNKSPTTSSNSKNSIESLFEKMNQQHQHQHQHQPKTSSKKKMNKNENEHFNSLLNKMMQIIDNGETKPIQTTNESSDILKWFSVTPSTSSTLNTNSSTNFSPTVLSEIEFMQMQRSKPFNKLY